MNRQLMNTSYLQSQVQKLHEIHRHDMSNFEELTQYLSEECSILEDLIPAYRIPEHPPNTRVKREVFSVETLEQDLLKQYTHFLDLLRKLSRQSHPTVKALASKLTARLVKIASEFNHNHQLLQLAVDFANAKSRRISSPCLQSLGVILSRSLGKPSQLIVEAILSMVRARGKAVNPKLISTLLNIRIAVVDMHRPDVTEDRHREKRMRKADAELARQMRKANARQSRAELAALQTKVLHIVFVIYLRLLEASQDSLETHQTRLLAPVLEGLAKFAPLVNVEHHRLLLQALRELLDGSETSTSTKLHALVAVACLVQRDVTRDSTIKTTTGALRTDTLWRVDLAHFHNVLFSCLETVVTPRPLKRRRSSQNDLLSEDTGEEDDDGTSSVGSVATTTGSFTSTAFSIAASMANQSFIQGTSASHELTHSTLVLLRALDLLFLSQRHIPHTRVTSVVRRILQLLPHSLPHVSLALLSAVFQLCRKWPTASSVVMGGPDHVIHRGHYDPVSQDLHSLIADGSFAWELLLLHRHPNPSLQELTSIFARHHAAQRELQNATTASASSSNRQQKRSLNQQRNLQKSLEKTGTQLSAMRPLDLVENYDPSNGEIQPPPVTPKRGTQLPARSLEPFRTLVTLETPATDLEQHSNEKTQPTSDSVLRTPQTIEKRTRHISFVE